MNRKPLNGVATHPLSKAALDVLAHLRQAPLPQKEINPGICNRLTREDLVDYVDLPSPYKTHKGRSTKHLRITPAGLAELDNHAKAKRA